MAQTQEIHSTIPTTGGTAAGNNGTVSYSVGQLVYMTNSGTTGSVAQGIQQPYEISTVTSIDEAAEIELNCSIYPNPVNDLLILKLGNYSKENLSYQLYDLNGKVILSDEVINDETNILLKNINPSVCFLKVMCTKHTIKTFKVIKNN